MTNFEPEMHDIAYELALGIAGCAGVKAKDLRPDTTLVTIFEWFQISPFRDLVRHRAKKRRAA